MSTPTCPVCGRTCGRTHGLEWTLGVRGVVRRGALATCVPRRARGRHTAPNRDLTATKRGNCTNRGATRRRHADRMLLMVQNPHRQPEIHPGAVGGGSESTGALRDTGLATAPAGGDPTTSRQISHVISPRSLFKITRKRCNSNDVDSTFEVNAWELRATLMGGAGTGRALRRHAGDTPKGGF